MGLTSITALRAVASSGFYPPWILAAAAVPPIFEYFLLTKVSFLPIMCPLPTLTPCPLCSKASGVPLLEVRALSSLRPQPVCDPRS